MSAARVIARPASVRSAIALSRRTRPTRRFQSTQSNPGPAAAGGGSGAIAGGVAGGLTAVLVGYGLYRYSGAHNAVSGYQTVKQNYENAIKRATKAAPEPNEAIQWLRQSANSYLGVVPGAKAYIDTTFDELESIHKEHGKEVDKIVKQAYNDLKEVSDKQGASLSGASQAWDIIQRAAKQVGELAKDVGGDVLERNPQLKEKFGGKFDELKRMGDQYGPEAKQKVDETWKQVQDILKGGLGAGSLAKIKSLVEEKVEDVKKLGDQAFDKGLEQAKPYLDKNPKVKEFVEQNKDKLKSANLNELWDKVKSAAQSGDTKELEDFAKQKASQAKEAGGQGLEKYMGMLPGGADVSEKIQQLQKLSDKHGEKFEKLLKEAFEEVRGVLEKKVDEGKKLASEAEKDAKS